MAPVLLIHGAWSSAAAWGPVVGLVPGARAIDLPGPEAADAGLGACAAAIGAALEGQPPALLVGHSMGGMAISAAAERFPERVRRLVYVAAFLPRSGESLLDLVKRQAAPTIQPAVRPGPRPGTTVLDAALAGPILMQDADEGARGAFLATLRPQASAPQVERAALTPARFGRVPRAYVFCTEDRTVPLALQEAMVAASPCAETFRLASGHFPQFTAAGELAAILARL